MTVQTLPKGGNSALDQTARPLIVGLSWEQPATANSLSFLPQLQGIIQPLLS